MSGPTNFLDTVSPSYSIFGDVWLLVLVERPSKPGSTRVVLPTGEATSRRTEYKRYSSRASSHQNDPSDLVESGLCNSKLHACGRSCHIGSLPDTPPVPGPNAVGSLPNTIGSGSEPWPRHATGGDLVHVDWTRPTSTKPSKKTPTYFESEGGVGEGGRVDDSHLVPRGTRRGKDVKKEGQVFAELVSDSVSVKPVFPSWMAAGE